MCDQLSEARQNGNFYLRAIFSTWPRDEEVVITVIPDKPKRLSVAWHIMASTKENARTADTGGALVRNNPAC